MKIYRYKLYSKAKRCGLHEEITRFGEVRNYAARMMEIYNRLLYKQQDTQGGYQHETLQAHEEIR